MPKLPLIILVDDEKDIVELAHESIKGLSAEVMTFTDPRKAWERLRLGGASVLVTDWMMPEVSGLDLLFKVRGLQDPPAVIFVSGFGTVPRTVQALMNGANDFIEKPFEPDVLLKAVQRALTRAQKGGSTASIPSRHRPEDLVISSGMRKVFDLARTAAQSDASVLLLGESGTGKEVVADFIHRHSRRAKGPMIKVNCGALPANLMESELFGHEKGAFTGADRKRLGRFELAHGGTLFLDEVGELPTALQVKLLRALQEHVIERVGGEEPITTDFRVVCATNRNLQQAIEKNEFREDVYYRINVVSLRLPPLRERPEDIVPLSKNFCEIVSSTMGVEVKQVSTAAMECLQGYHWPGNVRQLRNAIEYAVVMSSGNLLQPENLPEDIRSGAERPVEETRSIRLKPKPASIPDNNDPEPAGGGSLDERLQAYEKQAIEQSLQRWNWEIQSVLDDLKISRSRLYDRIKEYGIRRP